MRASSTRTSRRSEPPRGARARRDILAPDVRRSLLLLPLLLAACGESPAATPPGPPPAAVQVVTAAAQALPRTLSAVGSLESPNMTTIATEIAGTVAEIDVPEGKRVAAGFVLARLDDA